MANVSALYSSPEAYDRFDPTILRGHTEDLLDSGLIIPGKEFAVTVVDGNDPAAEVARAFEYSEFWREFGNSYSTMEGEYARYDAASKFILALKLPELKSVGVMRLIMDNPEGLKTLTDVKDDEKGWGVDMLDTINDNLQQRTDLPEEEQSVTVSQIADVATMAVNPGYRRIPEPHTINAALMRAGMIATLNSGRRDFIAVMDQRALGVFARDFDEPVAPIPGLPGKMYLGAFSYPTHGVLPEYFRRAAHDHEALSAMLERGTGLYSIVNHVTTLPELDRITV